MKAIDGRLVGYGIGINSNFEQKVRLYYCFYVVLFQIRIKLERTGWGLIHNKNYNVKETSMAV
jgi:hypothetical protein